MSEEFNVELHPEVRNLVSALDAYSQLNGIPEVFVTQIVRTVDDQQRIYVDYWKRLRAELELNQKLSPEEAKLAVSMHGKSDDEMLAIALEKFSWHMVKCAVDIRTTVNKHYSSIQLKGVVDYLELKTQPKQKWELLVHDVAGPHLHLGIRDFSYRSKYDPRKAKKS